MSSSVYIIFLSLCCFLHFSYSQKHSVRLVGETYIDNCTLSTIYWTTTAKLKADGYYYNESKYLISGDGFDTCLHGPWNGKTGSIKASFMHSFIRATFNVSFRGWLMCSPLSFKFSNLIKFRIFYLCTLFREKNDKFYWIINGNYNEMKRDRKSCKTLNIYNNTLEWLENDNLCNERNQNSIKCYKDIKYSFTLSNFSHFEVEIGSTVTAVEEIWAFSDFKIDIINKISLSPTMNPSITPTLNPSLNPTTQPTNNPTYQPTMNPSLNPTNNETFTLPPTINPSINPSINPTINPSINPTINPTSNIPLTQSQNSNSTLSPLIIGIIIGLSLGLFLFCILLIYVSLPYQNDKSTFDIVVQNRPRISRDSTTTTVTFGVRDADSIENLTLVSSNDTLGNVEMESLISNENEQLIITPSKELLKDWE